MDRGPVDPGAIRTWLSPPTALGMIVSGGLRGIGLGDHMDLSVAVFRGIATVIAAVILLWLVLKPQGDRRFVVRVWPCSPSLCWAPWCNRGTCCGHCRCWSPQVSPPPVAAPPSC